MSFVISAIISVLSFNMLNALLASCTSRYIDNRDGYARLWLGPTDFCEYTTIGTFVAALIICAIPFINWLVMIIAIITWMVDGRHDFLSKRPFKGLNK